MSDTVRAVVRHILLSERAELDPALMSALLKIDDSPYHMLPVDELESDAEIDAVDALAQRGYVKLLPATRRFPERLVLTGAGTHAIGTFDWDTLRDEKRPSRSPKVNGFGVKPMVKL